MKAEELEVGQWYVTRYGEIMEHVETEEHHKQAEQFQFDGTFGKKLVVARDIERLASTGEALNARHMRARARQRPKGP